MTDNPRPPAREETPREREIRLAFERAKLLALEMHRASILAPAIATTLGLGPRAFAATTLHYPRSNP